MASAGCCYAWQRKVVRGQGRAKCFPSSPSLPAASLTQPCPPGLGLIPGVVAHLQEGLNKGRFIKFVSTRMSQPGGPCGGRWLNLRSCTSGSSRNQRSLGDGESPPEPVSPGLALQGQLGEKGFFPMPTPDVSQGHPPPQSRTSQDSEQPPKPLRMSPGS